MYVRIKGRDGTGRDTAGTAAETIGVGGSSASVRTQPANTHIPPPAAYRHFASSVVVVVVVCNLKSRRLL